MGDEDMDEILSQIGNRIFERRKQLRMTQEELSERAEVMPQTIPSAERGQKSLRSENLFRVSKALGVSTDYLLTGSVTGDDLQYLSDKLICCILLYTVYPFILLGLHPALFVSFYQMAACCLSGILCGEIWPLLWRGLISFY